MKKVLVSLTIIFLLTFACSAISIEGNGTAESPYIITSVSQFAKYAESVNKGEDNYANAYVKLCSNLDFYGENYVIIGNSEHPFSGVFDGGGYVVRNISITDIPANNTSSEDVFIGMFGYSQNAVFENIYLDNINVDIFNSEISGNLYCGTICGKADGSVRIEQCGVTGNVNVSVSKAKLIVGGIISCVVSENTGLYMEDCFSDTDITAVSSRRIFAGGIIGSGEFNGGDSSLDVSRVFYKGSLSANTKKSSYVFLGGIIAYAIYEPDWADVYAETFQGNLSAEKNAYIRNSFSDCVINTESSNKYIGSVCGYNYNISTTNVYCSQDGFYGNNNYAIPGMSISDDYFVNKVFISQDLGFDVENTWICEDNVLTLTKQYYNNVYVTYNEKNVFVKGYIGSNNSLDIVAALKNEEGKLIRLILLGTEELEVGKSIFCDEEISIVQFIIFENLNTLKPALDDVNVVLYS